MENAVFATETARKRLNSLRMASYSANLLTIAEFCAAVRISERQYYRIRVENRGPAVTWLGGKAMIATHEVRRWLAEWTEVPGHRYTLRGK